MPITKNPARQELKVAEVAFTYLDLAPSASVQPAIELPGGAVVVGGQLVIDTAFNSATNDQIAVGDAASAARYLGDTVVRTNGARTALVPTGFINTGPTDVTIRWTGTGAAPTAGAGRLQVEYYIRGRSTSTQD